MMWCCSILPRSAVIADSQNSHHLPGMGNAPRFLHLLGEIIAGTDLQQGPCDGFGDSRDVLWAQEQAGAGASALSCSDCPGSFSVMPGTVPGSEPGWAGGTEGVAGAVWAHARPQ